MGQVMLYHSDYWHIKTYGDPNNHAILFLHGFMGDGDDWAAVIRGFMDNYYCITVDLPGHGKTRIRDWKRGYGMPETAKAVICLIDGLRISRCAIVGYSMGGRLALYLILHYPERFGKGVLESASPGLRKKAERVVRITHDDQIASELGKTPFDKFLDKWYLQSIFGALRGHPDFQDLLCKRKKNVPGELARSLRDMGTGKQASLWADLRNNRVPLLFLAGELDTKFSSIAYGMEQACPQSRVEIIAGCGHNIHFEKPGIFIESIKGFLKGNIEKEVRIFKNQDVAF
ncbi:MAG: 2-succinyl-6-hydroxy-2,4-cyclohexadiene-1-carboxylate synthase [bacterium]